MQHPWCRWLTPPVRRFTVSDTSMRPTLEPNDRVLVTSWGAIRLGDVIVFERPDAQSSFAIKRVADRESDGRLRVLGDNVNVSSDSRHFGPIAPERVIGRVVYRYGPPGRRGPLGARTTR
ncbi:MAG: hypothetical protein NVSMB2_12160 [Chloroflexota bacterium]